MIPVTAGGAGRHSEAWLIEMNPKTLELWIMALAAGLGVLTYLTLLQRTPKEQADRRRSLTIGFIFTTFGLIAFVAILVGLSRHWISYPR
jgi:bacteriorhodopsin